jgi:uncharacterized protein (TIGR03437 family)
MSRFTLVALVCLTTAAANAQPSRIPARIDANQTVVLRGRVPHLAQPQYDQGPVAGSFAVRGMMIYLKRSDAQQAALNQLLADQQNPASSNYHKWLTPEQFADRFGVSQADIAQIASWLKAQGFSVTNVARSRTFIAFDGTAQQVQGSFRTQIHRYLVDGRMHYANATAPSIPAALAGLVGNFRGLSDFHLKPRLIKRPTPRMNVSRGEHDLAPDDFATIYDIKPLYGVGIDGTGQKLAVVGQTDIKTSDISFFRSKFNLPAIQLNQVLVAGSADPGISQDDLPEADLDLEWASAVARNATIEYVYSDDIDKSITYAIDQDIAPVVTMSYGECEGWDLLDMPTFEALAQQANAEGITWLAAGGDSGAADCEDPSSVLAQSGPAVDYPASIPEVTGMGGTEFTGDLGFAPYWATSNDSNSASALEYIPEKVWDDPPAGGFAAGGGGESMYFPQPSWQTGPGVPNDGFRHVPDLSFTASADHDGYYVYSDGSAGYYGGTSAAAPTMAGVVVLLNQYLGGNGLGNINPGLYALAQSAPQAFHDITAGSNSVPCGAGSPECVNGLLGFPAGVGYDMASGLGSLDVNNFVHAWSDQPAVDAIATPPVVPTIDPNPVYETGSGWPLTIKLTEESGVASTLTGFTADGTSYDVATVFGSAAIPAHGSISSNNFTLTNVSVPKSVVFTFTGVDANGKQWTQTTATAFLGSQHVSIAGASNAASGVQAYAPGMLLSVYGTAMGDYPLSASAIPLPSYLAGFEAYINGISAPLYYVSPNQVNIQIPYETRPGQATLSLGNPFENAPDYTLQITSVAPGIFMSSGYVSAPFSSAARGQTTTLFITGDGRVTPSLADGTAPSASQTVKPVNAPTVTVAGEKATVAYYGVPSWAVGVTQINYTVPSDAPLGDQSVVVTVAGVQTQSAKLTITQ